MAREFGSSAPASSGGTNATVAAVAVAVAVAMLLHAGTGFAATGAFDPDRLAGLRARAIGPAAMSGRVTVVEGVDADPSTLYVGAAAGGVWKSVNGGTTWEPIFDDQPVASIGAIAVFQKSPDVVWVGTGEANVRNSASVGNGVYRSLDGGKTWSHLGLGASEHIARIVLHPSDPEVAWVAALGHEWGENAERGVFKTEDGGRSWHKVLFVDDSTGAADLALDPANPQHLLASMWQFRRWPWKLESGGRGSGIYATYDGGRSWKRRSEEDGLPKGALGRANLAFSRSHPEIVYALVEAAQSALLRSADGGRTWVTVNHSPNVAPRPFYFAELKVDPQWPNRVYGLGFNVKVSDDGGKTFANVPGDGKIHGDYHTMWIDPRDPRHFVVGDDGGIAVSYDRGRTEAFVGNLPLAQYYHVAVDLETPYNVYGGLQDNGSWRGPSATWETGGGIPSSEWIAIGSGDGFGTLPDPRDASSGYSMSQSGFLSRWDLKTGEIKDARPSAPDGVALRFNWNSGIALDPFDPDAVYYGSQFLHHSTDRGRSWAILSPDLTTNNPAWQTVNESGGLTPDASGAEGYTTILAIAPSPVARGVVWVGTDDGRVQLTRDGGKSWRSVEARVPGVPAHTWVPEIRASRYAAGTAFVLFDDHRRSNWQTYVYRTDDFGETWKSLATADVRGYALALEQDPVDPDLLFLGTEFGLWLSNDGGRHWLRDKYGLPTAPVTGLVVHPRERDLVVATHGRSLYVVDDIRPLSGLSAAILDEPLHLFPIADAQQHWQRIGPGGFGQGAGEFRGENRPYGALITFSVAGSDLPLPDSDRERERKERDRLAMSAAPPAAGTGGSAGRTARVVTGATPRSEDAESAAAPPAPPPLPASPASPASPSSGRGSGTASTEKLPASGGAGGAAAAVAAVSPRGAAAAGGAAGAPADDVNDEPKVQVVVLDAAGKAVRHFKAPVKLGINRVAWGFERDDFRAAPAAPDQPPAVDPAGPEVPPGVYTVSVRFRGREARSSVKVLADPRSRNTPADWQRRWEAIGRAGALQDAAVEAMQRLARLRSDVERAAADAAKAEAVTANPAKADQAKAEAAKADQAKANPVLDEMAAKTAAPAAAELTSAAKRLVRRLDELEKRLWNRPDAIGIQPPVTVFDQIGIAAGALTTQWDEPSPAQLIALRQAGDLLARFLTDFNAFYAGDVAAFRRQVVDAKIGLLAAEPPLAIDAP